MRLIDVTLSLLHTPSPYARTFRALIPSIDFPLSVSSSRLILPSLRSFTRLNLLFRQFIFAHRYSFAFSAFIFASSLLMIIASPFHARAVPDAAKAPCRLALLSAMPLYMPLLYADIFLRRAADSAQRRHAMLLAIYGG